MSIMNERVQKLGKSAQITHRCGYGSLSACHLNFIVVIQEKIKSSSSHVKMCDI